MIILKKIKECLYYHGTSKQSAKDICRHGMDISRKKSGSTVILKKHTGLNDRLSQLYNYVMGRESAANYAKLHKDPKIVRMVIPPNIPLESDLEGYKKDEKRTKSNISSHLILPLKPKKLRKSRVEKIISSLGLKPICCKKHAKELRGRIRSEIIENKDNSDKPFLEKSKSFIKMEQDRHNKTLALLSNQGIDIKSLKEGDEISVIF